MVLNKCLHSQRLTRSTRANQVSTKSRAGDTSCLVIHDRMTLGSQRAGTHRFVEEELYTMEARKPFPILPRQVGGL